MWCKNICSLKNRYLKSHVCLIRQENHGVSRPDTARHSQTQHIVELRLDYEEDSESGDVRIVMR